MRRKTFEVIRVDRESVFTAVADERRRLARLLNGLDAAQSATPSLCAGWDVQTVAAHIATTFVDAGAAAPKFADRWPPS